MRGGVSVHHRHEPLYDAELVGDDLGTGLDVARSLIDLLEDAALSRCTRRRTASRGWRRAPEDDLLSIDYEAAALLFDLAVKVAVGGVVPDHVFLEVFRRI